MRQALSALIGILLLAAQPAAAQTFKTEHYDVKLSVVADGLDHPWGMAFLPDGAILVTERDPGTIRIVEPDGKVRQPLANTPRAFTSGQGGMLDVAIDPDYSENKLIYFSYAEPGEGGAGTAVARARLDRAGNAVRNVEVLFRQFPKTSGGRHFGSRLVFSPEGHLFITVGERGERDRAQDFTVNRGQVIRINRDGSIPADNPFVGRPGYRPETWSVGHRNPQGAARHPETGKLWINEHGARGGDEVNIPLPGRNYGWPVIAYGVHYSGLKIGEGTHKDGMEQPVHYWDPSIAPSGMAFYTGDRFPKWRGNAFVGALKYQLLARLTLDGEKVVAEERILKGINKRIRAVVDGPDGYLYILVDHDPGQILRLEPAN
ncbi:PQQ-dependent sugar dehydrogenase [Thalassospiraceae bacterium LMO-JJ14]|nr:PQQ-dependent sugar dehydrogenase [Thalassospiraceae bacterium LMO-JJ14]